jgi:hypothetical protein
MQDQYLHPGLTFGSAEKDWLPAIRRVFWDWRPSPKQADDILDVLMARVEDRLDSIALLLSRVDPILMSRTLLPRLQGLTRDRGRAAAQELVEQVLGAVERSFSASEMLTRCADSMGVSPDFIETGLLRRVVRNPAGEKLSGRDASNVLLALNVEPFRALLASRLLREMRF